MIEYHALTGQFIDIWRPDIFVEIASQAVVPQGIDAYENDIPAFIGRFGIVRIEIIRLRWTAEQEQWNDYQEEKNRDDRTYAGMCKTPEEISKYRPYQ